MREQVDEICATTVLQHPPYTPDKDALQIKLPSLSCFADCCWDIIMVWSENWEVACGVTCSLGRQVQQSQQ